MPERDVEFSNPQPPPSFVHQSAEDDSGHPLTNEDFRKLLMTPRAPAGSNSASATSASFKKPASEGLAKDEDAGSKRRKRKLYYAKLKKLEEEKQQELSTKYRDRAAERRDGKVNAEESEPASTTADYRAVAPDAKVGQNVAERRKQIIDESKYLGGDMEHTHLVKGLDYALLEKVRAEINSKEAQDKDLEEALKEKDEKPVNDEDNIDFHSKMARNIFRTLFKPVTTHRSDLFLAGRTAYVVDLEEEFPESDVPTTLIRSKTDCPNLQQSTTLSTNDIVINKLTQILSYLRQGGRRDKKKKKDKKDAGSKTAASAGFRDDAAGEIKDNIPGADDVDIFADAEEFKPSIDLIKDRDRRDARSGREHEASSAREGVRTGAERDRQPNHHHGHHARLAEESTRDDHAVGVAAGKRTAYFEKPADEEELVVDRGPDNAKDFVKALSEKYSKTWNEIDAKETAGAAAAQKEADKRVNRLKKKTEIDSYAECYPGMEEAADAIDDSDDEVDYSKMDLGNKKGPVNRWDFDTEDQYQDYMANKEAMPKAAFQYGVKMADGRKTRRAGPKDEKAALDREWQQIQNIIKKRKETGEGGGAKGNAEASSAKKHKAA